MLDICITFDQEEAYHSSVATSVAWNGLEDVMSCGDDHQVLLWNLVTNETATVLELPPDVYPTAMKWQGAQASGVSTATGRTTNDLLLIAASHGSFYLHGKGNRLEKTVQAHQGAIISASWNSSGSEILTSGEDGFLRIWSRAGMLRLILAQHHMPVYSSVWGPDGRSVLYGLDKNLVIRQTTAGSRPVEWKAHDGLILCVAWSPTSNLIISGGEDCRYRVWHPDGRCLYTSPNLEIPLTSIAWAPSGELFAVGGSDMIRLCDRFGLTQTVENPKFGTVYALEWSSDGTQFAGATSEGHVFVANVIGQTCVWKNVEAVVTGPTEVDVFEFKANTKDSLEFQERVIHLSMNYGHLIVVLPTQVYIYNVANIPTHVICDLKEPNAIYLTLQSKRNFITCGPTGITSRSYDGRQLTQIKWPGMQSEMLNGRTTSLAEDMIALIDQSERRLIRVFDTHNGKLLHEERSLTEVIQVSLAQNDMIGPTERQMAYIDKSLDLFLTVVKRQGKPEGVKRLGSATVSILWHNEAPMLATIRESKIRIYYYPQILFVDETLLDHTLEEKEIGDPGPFPELVSFMESCIRARKADGTMISALGNSFVSQLFRFAADGNFGKARRLCHYVNVDTAWGVLAGLATSRGELDTAELCFTEIGHFDKVEFLSNSKILPEEILQKAHREVFIDGIPKGEEVLVKAGKFSDAIALNLDSMNWDRALELTLKHNEDPKALHEKRQEFLDSFNIEEFLVRYIELAAYLNKAPGPVPVGQKTQGQTQKPVEQQRKKSREVKKEETKDEIEEVIEGTED